jgi:uroporphyrinogen-III synthase/uroporphyrinogen III methyltransferase/synthase
LSEPPRTLSLAGRRVAVTRAGGDDALSRRLRELGAEVLEAPSIALAPPASFDELDAALRALGDTDWIAFASASAVERTVVRAAQLGIARAELARPRLAAVGRATAERLSQLVRSPDLVPGEARGEALAAALAPEVRGRRVLVPRAQEGRPELVEGLAGAGAVVVAPAAYRTVAAPPEALAPLARALNERAVDAVLFASPSAVRSVAAALGVSAPLLGQVLLAAIGPTTATELRAHGFAAILQPTTASADALAEAVAAQLGPHGL